MAVDDLKLILMGTLKTLSRRFQKGIPGAAEMQEFRLLVEEGRKLEDLGEVEKLKVAVADLLRRVMEIETTLNLRKGAGAEAAARRTPRIMG